MKWRSLILEGGKQRREKRERRRGGKMKIYNKNNNLNNVNSVEEKEMIMIRECLVLLSVIYSF
jgi:hypothetical protein